jgi:S1-C subfamily serine protease
MMKMKMLRIGLLFMLAAGLALPPATAIENPPAAGGTEDAEARLKDAKQRLEAAAREIAELTSQIVGDAGMEFMEEFSGRPRRAMLGINIGPVGGKEGREEGVQVLAVTPGGPADQAGLRSGDVLLALGETKLDWEGDSSPAQKLLDTLRAATPGQEIEVSYRRDGRSASAAVAPQLLPRKFAFSFDELPREREHMRTLLPPEAPRAVEYLRHLVAERWGDMELVALSPGLGEYFETREGVLVVRAPSDTTLGLEDGDVILDIAGRKPTDPGHVVRILRSYAPGERLVMTVIRKGRRQQLEADIPGRSERG